MTQRQASPAVTSRGTQIKQIVLTRSELIKILFRFDDFVKDKKAQDFPGWVDGIFAEADRDGAIIFNLQAQVGERFR